MQRTTFALGKILDSFAHALCCARCKSALFHGDHKFWESNWTFLLFLVLLCVVQSNVGFVWPLYRACSIRACPVSHNSGNKHLETIWIQEHAACLHHRSHEPLETLDWMLCSFDYSELSSPSKCCVLLGEMLDSFYEGLTPSLQTKCFSSTPGCVKHSQGGTCPMYPRFLCLCLYESSSSEHHS